MEVLFAEGKGFVPSIISKLTKSSVTHTALRYSRPEHQWLVHSSIGGVQPDWWSCFSGRYKKIHRFQTLFGDVADAALDAIVHRIAHAPYDYAGLLGQGAGIIFGTKNPFRDGSKYRCTEVLIAWHSQLMALAPSLKLLNMDPENVTPGDIIAYYRYRADLFKEIEP